MNTEELIVRLARDAQPVEPLKRPLLRLAGWLPVAVVAVAIGVAAFGLRSDGAVLLTVPSFVVDVSFALAILLTGGSAALLLAVPGAETRPTARVLASLALVVWAGFTLRAVIDAGHGFEQATHWPVCAARATGVGLLPGWVLMRLVRRAAPLQYRWASGLAAGAAMAAGVVAVELTCPLVDPGHVLLGHVLPVALAVVSAAALARDRLSLGTA